MFRLEGASVLVPLELLDGAGGRSDWNGHQDRMDQVKAQKDLTGSSQVVWRELEWASGSYGPREMDKEHSGKRTQVSWFLSSYLMERVGV